MSYPPAVDRRARRRRNIVIVLLLGVVVTVVALAVRYRTERREASDYLSVAQDLADRELDMSTSLGDLLATIGDLDRPDILLRLERLAEEGNAVGTSLDDVVVPRPVARASGLFSVAVENWANGIEALAPAFVAILDGADDDGTGDTMLAEAFQTLRVADAAYGQFLTAVDRLDDDINRGEFPVVALAGGENEPLFDAPTIASRLRLTRKLDEKHDVAVTATMEPEPVTTSGGLRVLPVAESYSIVAVVNNQGNVAEESIEVSLELVSNDGGLEPITLTELVPFLEPGEADTVVFGELALAPGRFFEMRLTASIAEDGELDDNVFDLPFFTNEA